MFSDIKNGSRVSGFSELREYSENQSVIRLDRVALAFFFRFGFVPAPLTVYSNVRRDYAVGAMHVPESCVESSAGLPFPFRQDMHTKSTRDYVFSEFDRAWLEAIKRHTPENKRIGVMLSGGKDSSALLYGLKRNGASLVDSYTYVPELGENEAPDAQALSEALNYNFHPVIADHELDWQAFVEVSAQSPLPSGDFAYPATCRIAKAMRSDGVETLLDGMGNDLYVGHIPPKIESRLKWLSLVRLAGKCVWGRDWFQNLLPNWRLQYLSSSLHMHPLERMFPGTRFSRGEIDEFGLPLDPVWSLLRGLDERTRGWAEYDQRAFVRGMLFDEFCAKEKSRCAAGAMQLDAVYPFVDDDFASYYLSLGLDERCDWGSRTNKVALRKYLSALREEYGVASFQYNHQKGSFRFNFPQFLQKNQDQLFDCVSSLEDVQALRPMLDFLYKKVPSDSGYVSRSKQYLVASFLVWLSLNRHGRSIELR